MKKLLLVLIALLLCATCLTACKEDDPTADNSTSDNQNQNDDSQNDDNQNDDVVYSEGLEFISNGDGTCYVKKIGTCEDTDVVIPPVSPDGDSVTSIGDGAFFNCNSMSSVAIPDGVTSIGVYVFSYCESLTSITIGRDLTYIADEAFVGCISLTDVYYKGSKEDFLNITIFGSYNDNLTDANKTYNYGE